MPVKCIEWFSVSPLMGKRLITVHGPRKTSEAKIQKSSSFSSSSRRPKSLHGDLHTGAGREG
jgi:hypothetical protein